MKYFILLFLVITTYSCLQKNSVKEKESVFYTDSIKSVFLDEYRLHNVYLPKNFNNLNKYKVIFATDGNQIKEGNYKKRKLDSLINNSIIPPIIYVESYYNGKIADSTSTILGNGDKVKLNYRNFEYVENQYHEGFDIKLKNRFNYHMQYFAKEFIPKVEDNLGLILNKNSRLFYGYSNGAGFGVSLLNKNPDLIGTYICYSTMGFNSTDDKWNKNITYPNLYLKYGNEEAYFLDDIHQNINENFRISNSFINIEVYEGGHDGQIWQKKFEKNLVTILNK